MAESTLRQLANDAGSDKAPTGKLPLRSRYPGYEYVPSLRLYVSDETKYEGWAFRRCRELLERDNSSMLSPPEFWEYYDHCKEKRPDIIEKLKTNDKYEYLDGIYATENSLIAIKPKLLEKKQVDFSKRAYSYNFPGSEKLMYFSREDVSEKHGQPYKTDHEIGEFCLFGQQMAWMYCPCVLTSKSNKIALGFYENNFDRRPDVIDIRGVRPCTTEGILKTMFSKGKQ